MKVREWLWMLAACYGIVGAALLVLPGWDDFPTWALWLIFAASPLIVGALAAAAFAVLAGGVACVSAMTRKG